MGLSIALIGDIMLDRQVTDPRLLYHAPSAVACAAAARPIPMVYPNTPGSRDWLRLHGVDVSLIAATSHSATCRRLADPAAEDVCQPFEEVSPLLQEADVVIGNLETPLSVRGRPWRLDSCFRASPAYAAALAAANIRCVTLANNHAMDFGEVACGDTLQALRENGIVAVGAGLTYEEAREPVTMVVGGIRLGLLGYSMTGPDETYATPGVGGVAPLNLQNIEQDANHMRRRVDCLIAAVHWGIENTGMPLTQHVWLAHAMADLGFDLVVGWHPHVPGPIEFFKRSLVCYSMGNCVFGHGHSYWSDNMIVVVRIEDGEIASARVIPIDTRGERVFRPAPADPDRAALLLRQLAKRSVGATFESDGGLGAVVTRARHA